MPLRSWGSLNARPLSHNSLTTASRRRAARRWSVQRPATSTHPHRQRRCNRHAVIRQWGCRESSCSTGAATYTHQINQRSERQLRPIQLRLAFNSPSPLTRNPTLNSHGNARVHSRRSCCGGDIGRAAAVDIALVLPLLVGDAALAAAQTDAAAVARADAWDWIQSHSQPISQTATTTVSRMQRTTSR